MENFEGKIKSVNMLHTVAYLSYLDKLSEVNHVDLEYQKDFHLKELCLKADYSSLLYLNLILCDSILKNRNY